MVFIIKFYLVVKKFKIIINMGRVKFIIILKNNIYLERQILYNKYFICLFCILNFIFMQKFVRGYKLLNQKKGQERGKGRCQERGKGRVGRKMSVVGKGNEVIVGGVRLVKLILEMGEGKKVGRESYYLVCCLE